MQEINVNKVVLIGSLEREPELRYTSNNTAILNLRVVTTESYVTRDGQVAESRATHSVIVWGQKGERLKDQLYANSRIFVEGSLRNRSYEDNTGNRKWITEINAQTAFPINRDNSASMQQEGQGMSAQPQQTQPYAAPPAQQSAPPAQQSAPPAQQSAPPAQQSAPPAQPAPPAQHTPPTGAEEDLPF